MIFATVCSVYNKPVSMPNRSIYNSKCNRFDILLMYWIKKNPIWLLHYLNTPGLFRWGLGSLSVPIEYTLFLFYSQLHYETFK